MRRLQILVVAVLLGLSSLAAAASQDPDSRAAARLNGSVSVVGPEILLGDLFSGIGELAEVVIAKAPPPGRQVTLDARWLWRVARAYKLNWQPLGEKDVSIVRRQSDMVARADVEQAILSRLIELGAEDDMSVTMGNRMLRLHVAIGQIPSVAVDDIVYDPRSRRFSAVLRAPADDPAAPRVRASGRLQRMSEIPVPARDLPRGTVIKAADLKWIRMPTRRLHREVIGDTADLIGKTPRRSLRRDRPIRFAEVRRPSLVNKRGLVTLHLRVGNMSLSARGKAMQDGSLGDVVRVTNLQSKTIVEGVVIGPNKVRIDPPARMAMN